MNLKEKRGTTYHDFIEGIHGRYFEPDGTRKTKITPKPFFKNMADEEIYNRLERYYLDLVKSHSKDGKKPLVFSEIKIYDLKKEAGTIDLLIVDPDGKTHIYDWKFMSSVSWF